MVQFKFIEFFFRVIKLELTVAPGQNPEIFKDSGMMPLENGIVKYSTPFINRYNFQNCLRVVFDEIISAFGNGRQYLDKIIVVTNDFIINITTFYIAKSKVETAFTYRLKKHHFQDSSFWADAFKKIALSIFSRNDVVSLPQHVQLIFCLVKNAGKIQCRHNFFNSKNEMQ